MAGGEGAGSEGEECREGGGLRCQEGQEAGEEKKGGDCGEEEEEEEEISLKQCKGWAHQSPNDYPQRSFDPGDPTAHPPLESERYAPAPHKARTHSGKNL